MWWIWKHRKAERQIRELWEKRIDMLRFMGDVNMLLGLGIRPSDDALKKLGKQADGYVKSIHQSGIVGIPLARPWKLTPPPPPPEP